MVRVAIITGLSGSGKTTALRALEDLGWLCMDNLPVVLLPKVIELAGGSESDRRIGLVVDVREPGFIRDAGAVIDDLRGSGASIEVLFLDADPDVLITRFQETRRRHPLDKVGNIRQAIEAERALLDELRVRAGITLDSTRMTSHDLKREVQEVFAREGDRVMRVRVASFGFKHGPMSEADLVLDVRFLPNPHFDPTLRHRTGLDVGVARWLRDHADTVRFEQMLHELLLFLAPRYAAEGKAYLTIAIGCTGGQHRSVAISEKLAEVLADAGFRVEVEHRDRNHWSEGPA